MTRRLHALIAGLTLCVASLAAQPVLAQTASAPAAEAPAATPAAPAPVAPPLAATTTKESVDNPYGLAALWAQGDFVAKGTLIILVIMSMGSWYILVTKLYESLKMSGEARKSRGFFKSASLAEGVGTLKQGGAFHFIAESGIAANDHHEGALTEHIDRNTWVTMSVQRAVDEVQSRLQDGLAFLATVGSTAPFVGLFGTVWGIYHALTAIGLAVAVPAVLGYNWLVRRNKVTMDSVRGFAADLHGVLMGAKGAAASR